MNTYPRNPHPRFNLQSEQASESALVNRNNIETVNGTGGPPIILDYPKENKLSVAMLSLYESLLPTKESHEKRKLLANKVEKILNDEWPDKDIKVHMFGSSMNELGTTHSDVDLCVTTHWNGLKNIFNLTKCLEKYKEDMIVQQTVHKAKVPIVRLFDRKLELACDINVNNTLALHNTRLIRNYVSIDARVRPLAMIVKYWARRRVLNDAAMGGTISTYTWTCIILNFLQMRDPPILPVLHKIPHEGVEPIMVNGEDASFFEDVGTLTQFGSLNKETVGGLLFAFFRRMAYEFDYDKHVISLRQGKYLTKVEKGWDTGKGWKMLCVEEPFNTARNLGNSADDISVNGLIGEFQRAYGILYETACLSKLCEEYRFPPTPNHNYCNGNRGKSRRPMLQCKFNRKGPMKSYQQNGQNNYLSNTMVNFHDINGKNNDPQDEEEDGSNMRRFSSEELIPASEIPYFCENNECTTRKQFDNIQNQNPNKRYNFNQHHNVPKEDEQPRHRIRQKNSYYTKKRNDDQFNNYGQSQDSEHEGFVRYDGSVSNQSQPVYKNNKVENIPHNKKVSTRNQHPTMIFYDSDNKYNNYSHSRYLPSDSDQKSFITYNSNDLEKRNYYKPHSNKHGYNAKQVEEPISGFSSNSNFDRSNPIPISSPKSSYKSNNKNRKHMQSPRQHQKVNENGDFTNIYYNHNKVDDSISSNSIPPSNNGNGNLAVTLSPSVLPLSSYYRQSNDGSTSYQRRMSHQSSSDGSNSQTSGNTSNTSNTSYSSTHSAHTKNNYPKNNNTQNNYQQQNHQNKPNYNNGFRKKKHNNNHTNGYNNSGNGNFRMNNTTNNSTSIALNCSDSSFQDVTFSANQGQGGQGHYSNDYNANSDTNGYKAHNSNNGSFKVYNNNSNSSNNWKGSNGHYNTNSKIISGNNNANNGTKLANGSSSFSNRNVNSNNLNNNYPRSNYNHNNSNNHMRNQNNNNNNANSHKSSINGSNNKPFDGSNNSNTQPKNSNNNYSNSKNGGNNQINNRKNNRHKNFRGGFKAENKEDGVNYHQQYSQETFQERQNIQPQQQKKMGQNGQNNNSGKGKGYKKHPTKQNVECQQQQ